MSKSEVYSWRLSRETKAILEDEARRRGSSLADVLERIVQEWRRGRDAGDDTAEQARLHAAAARSFGRLAGRQPYSAARTREVIRQRLGRPRAS
jgi:hypothetical protein